MLHQLIFQQLLSFIIFLPGPRMHEVIILNYLKKWMFKRGRIIISQRWSQEGRVLGVTRKRGEAEAEAEAGEEEEEDRRAKWEKGGHGKVVLGGTQTTWFSC